MSANETTLYQLTLLQGEGVTLLLENHNGSTGTLTGLLVKTENGVVVIQSRGKIIPVKLQDVRDVWRAKGEVEP